MHIENSFEVDAPIDRVWAYMLDVERVVPCMPGAELTETIDDSHWKGKVTIKLGPVSLSFAGKVRMEELNETERRAILKASGMEQKGKGAASATIMTTLLDTGGGTRVDIVQDLSVSGQVAQMSRGMMQDVSSKLTLQFADCLKKNMQATGDSGAGDGAAVATAKPPGGIRLAFYAMGQAIKRFFARFRRRRER